MSGFLYIDIYNESYRLCKVISYVNNENLLWKNMLSFILFDYTYTLIHSTALRCGSFSKKKDIEKSICAVMIRIIITFADQIFL